METESVTEAGTGTEAVIGAVCDRGYDRDSNGDCDRGCDRS